MKQHKKKYHQEWNSSDQKPNKKMRRAFEGSNRVAAKEEITREQRQILVDKENDVLDMLNREANAAIQETRQKEDE